MFITMGLAARAVNATCDNLQGDCLVSEEETECMLAFSRDTGRRVVQGSCSGGRLLLDYACLTPFIVHMGLV